MVPDDPEMIIEHLTFRSSTFMKYRISFLDPPGFVMKAQYKLTVHKWWHQLSGLSLQSP